MLCSVPLLKTSKKRNLYGSSFTVVLQVLQAKEKELGMKIVPSTLPSPQGSFLCIRCFVIVEKVSNARRHLHHLESELQHILSNAGVDSRLQSSQGEYYFEWLYEQWRFMKLKFSRSH